MAISLRKEDYMGRDLVNGTPGTTDPVTDYTGRVTTATADYLGRTLTVLPWPGAVAVTLGSLYYITGGELIVTVAGTPAAPPPTIPGAVGGTVVSGTATFTRTE